ncbi:MAG: FAD-dependent oxidoreductase [Candidatus Thermoplasmatota archaeon]|nr:FAD-dependent oxidoreductase [Candidatus Thermoplasmatota archaeon]MBS3801168.1 FAD-dependent oxidoreductase [Candidatus Thermoplasmatota archaeon]
MRIKDHPILSFQHDKAVTFSFNGKKLSGYSNDTIAAALHANGIVKFSESLRFHRARGFFCGIGKCSSCLMRVNNIPNVRTCIAPLTEDVTVETQDTFASWPKETHNTSATKADACTVDVLIVGGGPAGLEAAVQAAKQNAKVLLVDENQQLGGQLIKQTHKFFGSKQENAGTRGVTIAKELEETVQDHTGIELLLESTVIGFYEDTSSDYFTFAVSKRKGYESSIVKVQAKTVIFAVGAMENMLLFPGNDLPGVYGAGAVQTLMNVYGVKPGNHVLMVGAGNVGLIVSYQLLQAGILVDRVVEAAPIIGGYHVHAAKLRRCGVPIYTRHSIKEIIGSDHVEAAVVVRLDENWQEIPGSEKTIECDTVCLAVGLTPSTRLLSQMGVKMYTIAEAGGFVAIHDDYMQTSVPGVFVAGDNSGIEEASTAMIEGKIAGVAAAIQTGKTSTKQAKELLDIFASELASLRAGPFGEKPRIAKQKIQTFWRKNQ